MLIKQCHCYITISAFLGPCLMLHLSSLRLQHVQLNVALQLAFKSSAEGACSQNIKV